MSDFYIGYQPSAPAPLVRYARRVIVCLFVLAGAVACVLVIAQQPFAEAFFEYGEPRTFEGTVQVRPYPALLVMDPASRRIATYALVAPGKHGADDLVRAWDGKRIQLQGELIHRGGNNMIQIAPESIRAAAARPIPPPATEALGLQTITGEIVDTKCYLGVMNPGQGKVHRDCASRCLSGGIPAAIVVKGELYYLPGDATFWKRHAGEMVTVQGMLIRRGGSLVLEDPRVIRLGVPDGR
jgi:hypothetical protein